MEQYEREVSMKSGLEGRNNPHHQAGDGVDGFGVSMKSGLEGRNNADQHGASTSAP